MAGEKKKKKKKQLYLSFIVLFPEHSIHTYFNH